MAEFDPSPHIGVSSVAPTEQQLEDIARYDRSLAKADLAGHLRKPASTFVVTQVPGLQVPAGSSVTTLAWTAPFPCRLLRITGGAQVHGGSLTVLTFDVLVEPAAGGGYVSVLDAVEDILTAGAGITADVSPEDGSEDLAAGDKVRVAFAATTDTADGAAAYLLFQRL